MKPDLESAVIAASAALLGVALSQVFSLIHKAAERKHEQRVFLRQKFEEMTFHFLESLGFVQELSRCTSVSEIQSVSVSPRAQAALVLCQLYFPYMEVVVERYVFAQQAYFQAAVESFRGVVQPRSLAVFVSSSHDLNKELFEAKNEVIAFIKIQSAEYTDAG